MRIGVCIAHTMDALRKFVSVRECTCACVYHTGNWRTENVCVCVCVRVCVYVYVCITQAVGA